MINSTYKVVYGAYEGYADTTEEAEEMEKKFKLMSESEEKTPLSTMKSYDDYVSSTHLKEGA